MNEIIDEESKLKNKKVNGKAASFGRNVLCFGKFRLYIRYVCIYMAFHVLLTTPLNCVCVCVSAGVMALHQPNKKSQEKKLHELWHCTAVIMQSEYFTFFLSFFFFFFFFFFLAENMHWHNMTMKFSLSLSVSVCLSVSLCFLKTLVESLVSYEKYYKTW